MIGERCAVPSTKFYSLPYSIPDSRIFLFAPRRYRVKNPWRVRRPVKRPFFDTRAALLNTSSLSGGKAVP